MFILSVDIAEAHKSFAAIIFAEYLPYNIRHKRLNTLDPVFVRF